MSIIDIRSALEVKLETISHDIETAWEKSHYEPTTGKAYQQVNLMLADPENPIQGNGMYRQTGYMQVTLKYPKGKGTLLTDTKSDLIRTTFYRGLTLTSGTTTVLINRTPSIRGGLTEDERSIMIVRIFFFAEIFN